MSHLVSQIVHMAHDWNGHYHYILTIRSREISKARDMGVPITVKTPVKFESDALISTFKVVASTLHERDHDSRSSANGLEW